MPRYQTGNLTARIKQLGQVVTSRLESSRVVLGLESFLTPGEVAKSRALKSCPQVVSSRLESF